jgi:hypothetical protein
MTFSFRVSFKFTGSGTLKSDNEFIQFVTKLERIPLKLSSGSKGVPIGDNNRFSISGSSFLSEHAAHKTAASVRHALLLYSARTQRGIDLGQDSLNAFAISPKGKEMLAGSLGASVIMEDHLGITVFPSEPKPTFVRMNMSGYASSQASHLTDELSQIIGVYSFKTAKAEIAAGLYSLSHFTTRTPARFLILFIALEALIQIFPRSDEVASHVDDLISYTRASKLSQTEKEAICSILNFQKSDSIAAGGRRLVNCLLKDETYDSLTPALFFAKIYRVRNNLVHRGEFDPVSMHVLIGEVDRFVANLITAHAVITKDCEILQ